MSLNKVIKKESCATARGLGNEGTGSEQRSEHREGRHSLARYVRNLDINPRLGFFMYDK